MYFQGARLESFYCIYVRYVQLILVVYNIRVRKYFSVVDIALSTHALVAESSKFCKNWAQVLMAQGTSSPDPFFLRHAVENYKLKV